MKIALVTTWAPFVRGGAELLAETLEQKLREHGHRVLPVRLPFRWDDPAKIYDHMLACRLVRLVDCDRVIAFKFPSYYVEHPVKVVWLLHQFRQVYDLWGTPLQGLPDDAAARQLKRSITEADRRVLSAARVYCNSHVTQRRLKRFNDVDADVLLPPLMEAGRFECRAYEPFLLLAGRITSGKRQHLAVEALRHAPSARLLIAGQPETSEDQARIEDLLDRYALRERVTFLPRFVTLEEKLDLFSRARACIYAPVDEDSYGYVTLEAFQSSKPVITCSDSGGVLDLVRDGETGRVCAPDPEGLGRAMEALVTDEGLARKLGTNARAAADAMRLDWAHVVERLTS